MIFWIEIIKWNYVSWSIEKLTEIKKLEFATVSATGMKSLVTTVFFKNVNPRAVMVVLVTLVQLTHCHSKSG